MSRSREHPHDGRSQPGFTETWSFDAVIGDDVALFVAFAHLPDRRRGTFVAALVGTSFDYLLCKDDSIPVPRSLWPLEVRPLGLWMHAICEEPERHWTVAMEAFATSFDDRMRAWEDERGDPTPLAFELEWETDSEVWRSEAAYELAGSVFGEIHVGSRRIDVAASGTRRHSWGEFSESFPGCPCVEGTPGATSPWAAPVLIERTQGPGHLLLSWEPATLQWSHSWAQNG